MRALLEGLAIASRIVADELVAASGAVPQLIVVAGQPTRHRLWNDLRAAVSRWPLLVIDTSETTALGAALLAQRALTGRADAEVVERTLWPPETQAEYSRLLKLYGVQRLTHVAIVVIPKKGLEMERQFSFVYCVLGDARPRLSSCSLDVRCYRRRPYGRKHQRHKPRKQSSAIPRNSHTNRGA